MKPTKLTLTWTTPTDEEREEAKRWLDGPNASTRVTARLDWNDGQAWVHYDQRLIEEFDASATPTRLLLEMARTVFEGLYRASLAIAGEQPPGSETLEDEHAQAITRDTVRRNLEALFGPAKRGRRKKADLAGALEAYLYSRFADLHKEISELSGSRPTGTPPKGAPTDDGS